MTPPPASKAGRYLRFLGLAFAIVAGLCAIGFLPKHLVWLVLGEAAVLGVIGGALGLALAFPVVQFGIGRFVEENMSGFFPYFRISLGNAIAAFGLALALATLASGIPAFQASRLKVVDALRRVA